MGVALLNDRDVSSVPRREIVIDFQYLDLETCTRCRGTDANLELALADVGRVLDAAGVSVVVRKTLVESAEQARALDFVSSPTIRVNGQDLALELRESHCDDCTEACACEGSVDCRIWVWQGAEHSAAPQALIVDAILRQVYGGAEQIATAPPAATVIPENLERFFASKARMAVEPAGCCSPAKQATCCEPSEKASCCGEGTAGGCGCQ
jgi:hypothetical protein